MLNRVLSAVLIAIGIGCLLSQSGKPSPVELAMPSFSERELRFIRGMIGPKDYAKTVAPKNKRDSCRVELGHLLFYDSALGGQSARSCAHCHDPAKGWADGRTSPEGGDGKSRRTPPLWNVGDQRWFFWDGRADSLWSQALGPLESDREVGTSRVALVRQILASPTVRQRYELAFGVIPEILARYGLPQEAKPMLDQASDPRAVAWNMLPSEVQQGVDEVFVNLGKALAAFEQQIVAYDSPFDAFARNLFVADSGEKPLQISSEAQRGLQTFLGKGQCVVCHHGRRLTDEEFHNIFLPSSMAPGREDRGRYVGLQMLRRSPFNAHGIYGDAKLRFGIEIVAPRPEHWGQFKTPSLRNVALGGPFMHSGQFGTLSQVINYYNTLEGAAVPEHYHESLLRPLRLTVSESHELIEFLKSLTDSGSVQPRFRVPLADSSSDCLN